MYVYTYLCICTYIDKIIYNTCVYSYSERESIDILRRNDI